MSVIQDICGKHIEIIDGIFGNSESGSVSYPSEGYDHCFSVENNSYWFAHRAKILAHAVDKLTPNGVFLDIGGGNGFMTKKIQNHVSCAILIEPGRSGAINAKSRGVHHVVNSKLEDLNIDATRIDGIGIFDVLEHIEDDGGFLSLLNDRVKDKGYLFIMVPAFNWLWSNEDDYAGHYRRYTIKSLKKLLEKASFSIHYSTYFFSVLVLPILLLRTIADRLGVKKEAAKPDQAARDHSTSSWVVKNILHFLLKIERWLIQRKYFIPIGASCFIIAQKNKNPT